MPHCIATSYTFKPIPFAYYILTDFTVWLSIFRGNHFPDKVPDFSASCHKWEWKNVVELLQLLFKLAMSSVNFHSLALKLPLQINKSTKKDKFSNADNFVPKLSHSNKFPVKSDYFSLASFTCFRKYEPRCCAQGARCNLQWYQLI